MLIPNKYSGYQAGIRLYPGGGGGGGGQPGTGNSQVGNTGGTTGITGAVIPPPPQPQAMTAQIYNQNLQRGITDEQMRTMRSGPGKDAPFLYDSTSPNQWNEAVTQAAMQSPTGRPLAGSAQFFQPVYQPQYQDLNTGNRMGVSQFGQTPTMPQMQTPFNFGGQMMGGGYGQFGMNNPFSPYSNSFLNMPSSLQGATPAQKADVYRDAMSRGFNDTQMRSQATGLYGPQSNQDWGYLQGLSMGMTPALGQGTMQNKVDFYNQARNQGYSDSVIRNAANQMVGQQGQSDWSYLQNQAAQMAPMQSPFRSSGPASRIVSRSSQARGTPNVMRRAEGGIASLVDDE